jgi:Ca2+-binding EF-hand superfamily protein
MLLQPQGPGAGQDLPGAAAQPPTADSATAPQPTSSPNAAQFVSNTLASLLSTQEAPPSSANVAAKIIGVADTNGDGSLSLSEIEAALGADTTSGAAASGSHATSGADALGQAFSSIDANGDGQISAGELTNALDAQKAAHGAHHGHHHGRNASELAASSSELASQAISSADTDGDGQLSLAEIQKALGTSAAAGAADALTSAIGALDSNADGLLSPAELSAGIDAFRAAHHRSQAEAASQSAASSTAGTQAVTA